MCTNAMQRFTALATEVTVASKIPTRPTKLRLRWLRITLNQMDF